MSRRSVMMVATGALVVMTGALSACAAEGGGQTERASRQIFDYEAIPFGLMETTGGERVGVFTRYDVIFASPSGGRVEGRLHRPPATDDDAGVILLHGSGGHAREMDAHAEALACSGSVALALDAPSAGRGASFVSFTEDDYQDQIRLIKDLRRSVDLLIEEYDVHPDRLGFFGVSYGAAMGSLFVGVEPRIDAAALMVGDGGLVAHFTESDEPLPDLADVPNIDEWIQRMAPIEPSLFLGDAAPMPVLLVSGTEDEAIPQSDARAWHEAAGAGSEVVWVETGHGLNDDVWVNTYTWLARNIGLDEQRVSECATS